MDCDRATGVCGEGRPEECGSGWKGVNCQGYYMNLPLNSLTCLHTVAAFLFTVLLYKWDPVGTAVSLTRNGKKFTSPKCEGRLDFSFPVTRSEDLVHLAQICTHYAWACGC